jgi:enoyl-CoA hydratase/carnithine racemase
MNYESITVNREGEIAYLTLNRPQTNNMLNREMFLDVIKGLEGLGADDEVRLIIVKGAGKHFCFGADIAQIVELDDEGCRKFFFSLGDMYEAFHDVGKVTIAMVHGYCTAGGLGIALSCDLIVASEDAQFGATAIKPGLFCLATSGVMLSRIVGGKKALEMGLTGDVIGAAEAERVGIVNRVVPMDKLESATMEIAKKILDMNPLAIAMGRENFYTVADMEFVKGVRHSSSIFAHLAATKEAKEGMRAFLEKREPRWSK